MKRLKRRPQKIIQVDRIHKFLKLHANASLTINFCIGSDNSETMSPTFAAALAPERFPIMSGGRPALRKFEPWMSMPFWKTTPPITAASEVERLRIKPRVPIAVAMSSWDVMACKAIRGGSKRRPPPTPAISWKPIIIASDESASSLMKSPLPIAYKARPIQIHSRYRPVL